MLASLMQRFFLKNIKGDPKKNWLRRAKALGEFQSFEVLRQEKKLSCFFIHPRSSPSSNSFPVKKIVLFSHPLIRKGKYFFTDSDRARIYLDQGFSVVAFDYNGFGESDVIDLHYWKDVSSVVEHLKSEFPCAQIVLHGVSFGAFHAIRAVESLPLGSQVVLENVNKSLQSYWRRWPFLAFVLRFLEVFKVSAIREMDVQKVVGQLHRHDICFKFFACENDQVSTKEEMIDLYELLISRNKTFFLFKGGVHLSAPQADSKLYQNALFG